jgi:hypothetical protein
MPAKFSTFKAIIGECKQCNGFWMYEGWDDGKRYKDFKSPISLVAMSTIILARWP